MDRYGETGINKYREMNDSRIKKGLRVIKREGLAAFFMRFAYYLSRLFLRAVTPLVLIMPNTHFIYNDKKFEYFRHKKSLTWTNERAIEIPIVVDHIKSSDAERILEVGAVLPHYYPSIKKDVVDKFEKGEGIINKDILEFVPKEKYGLVVSISTLEHVGFDDDVKDNLGTLKAIEHIKKNCIKKGGKMIITMPINYNKGVDEIISDGGVAFSEETYFARSRVLNRWKEVSKESALKAKYSANHANAIVIGAIEN